MKYSLMLVIAFIKLCLLAHNYVLTVSFNSLEERPKIHDSEVPSNEQDGISRRRRDSSAGEDNVYSLNNTFFRELLNYEVFANPADEIKYPWIALVSHSPYSAYPYLCTAACIKPKIFVTTANCLASSKIPYLTVRYRQVFFGVKASIIPHLTSKQMFDDPGFIVVRENPKFKGFWMQITPIRYSRGYSPSYNEFEWFESFEDLRIQHKVVAYATKKYYYKLKTPDITYDLVELPVYVGIDLCTEILALDNLAYHVPCYSACTPEELNEEAPKCQKYLGSEGGAVVNTTSGELIGVASWGVYTKYKGYELPVGICLVNSNKFKNCLKCAEKIVRLKAETFTEEEYSQLCGEVI